MRKLVVAILFVALLIGFNRVNGASGWEFIYSDDNGDVFFATQSFEIDKDSKTYTVWMKTEFNEEFCERITKTNNYEKPFSHTISQVKIDYKNKRILYLTSIAYDVDGGILGSMEGMHSWEDIMPETSYEKVFNSTYNCYKEYYM